VPGTSAASLAWTSPQPRGTARGVSSAVRTYLVEGADITDLASLFAAFAKAVDAPDGYFGRCLRSFDDCLFGGFGLEAPCVIVWKNCAIAREALGSDALAFWCAERLAKRDYLDQMGKEWLLNTQRAAIRRERSLFDEVVDMLESVTERAGKGNVGNGSDWTLVLRLE